MYHARRILGLSVVAFLIAGCTYVRLLRPSVVRQLNPDVARLVNYLPNVDDPNEAIVARLFAHGGLAHAREDGDSIMRVRVRIPEDEFIWRPAVIVMPRPGTLEIEFSNDDRHTHAADLPSADGMMHLDIPPGVAGTARIRLDNFGYYSFGCPVANHSTRGMLGVIIVEGETPAEAKLDRPPQRQPGGSP